MPPEIFNKDFISVLDSWLFENDQKFAKQIASKKSKIPPIFKTYSKKLYRGMIVDEGFIEKASTGMSFDKFSSWSKSEKVAMTFSKDPKYRTQLKTGIPMLVSKVIPQSNIILDIHSFCLFTGGVGFDELSFDSALKEEEVLIDIGVKITTKDIRIL